MVYGKNNSATVVKLMENELTVYQAVIDEIREIIHQGRTNAYQAISAT